MPWNDNKGGGSGGPWGSGSNGDGDKSPWGRPSGDGEKSPDIEDSLRKMQERFANRRRGNGKGGGGGGRGGKGLGGAGIALIGVFALAGWFLTGVYQVSEQEQAVVLRFGEFHRTSGPGFHVRLPDPLESHEIVTVNQIRSTQIGSGSNEGLMLTGDENIVDIDFQVQWRVNNPQDYLFNVRNPEETLRWVSESVMREIVGKRELDPILAEGRDEVALSVRELMQETLDSYGTGIQVTEVNLDKSDPPATVIDAFRDVSAAEQDRVTLINEATAYANKVVPEARGAAQRLLQEAEGYCAQVIANSSGEAERFRLVYEEYRKAPRVTKERMYLETMEKVLGRSEQIILDNEAGAVPYLPLDQLRRGGN